MQVDLQDIKGVIFDLDGTLVESELDFGAMRKHLGVSGGHRYSDLY